MISRLRQNITYANTVSTIALFVVLGGGAYAAVTLPKNSVGTKQLKKSAVTSVKVKDRSLLATDFKAGQIPAGAKGDTGAAGVKGDTGATGPAGAKGDAGAAGAKGDKGDTGLTGPRGPSSLQQVKGADVADLDNTSGSTLASAVLTSGKYLVQAKTVLSSAAASMVDCSIFTNGNAGTPIDSATVKIPAGGQAEVNLVGAEALGSNFLLFVCDDNGAAGGATAAVNKLTALQVETLG
jgi:hypothetical protein